MALISGFYTGLIVILGLCLTMNVILGRRNARVWLGDGEDKELIRQVRAHANLIETAPLFLIMLVLMELNGAPSVWLHLAGVGFVAARIIHALGLLNLVPRWPLRLVGMLVTIVVMAVSAVYLIMQTLIA